MKKDVSQYLPCEKFIVKKLLSHGSYGIVYLAYSHIQHQTVAVKVEKTPRGFNLNASNLQREIYNLQQLEGIQGVPQVLDFDCEHSQYSYFSMEMLGKDFSQLLKKCNNMFSHKTVLMIAAQVVNILKQIHQKGFIHRDIKPENLVLGRGANRNKVYMIDFGTAKSFIDKTTKKHVAFQEKQPFVGTYRYASKSPHFGYEQSRKDDLESLGYVLIYLCKGRLPWQDLREYNQGVQAQQKVIGQMKLDIPIDDLCEGLPSFFHWYMHFVNALKFDEEPNYELIIEKINSCLSEELKCTNDNDFDWSAFSMNQSYVCLSNQDVISMYSSINNYNSINSNYNKLQTSNQIGGQTSNQNLLQVNTNMNIASPLNNHHSNNKHDSNNILQNSSNERAQNSIQNTSHSKALLQPRERIKTFNKSKSAGVQNTHVQSFEENYSRQVHCEMFPSDCIEAGEDSSSIGDQGIAKHIPYLFQPNIRQKQATIPSGRSCKSRSELNDEYTNGQNCGNMKSDRCQKLNQDGKEEDDETEQFEMPAYQARSYHKRDTNDYINNTSRLLQNISINIPTSANAKYAVNIKKSYYNEPIQEDNFTQENTQTIDSFLANQDEVSHPNQKSSVNSVNNTIYTSKQPRFISPQNCMKEASSSCSKDVNNSNVLKAQLS